MGNVGRKRFVGPLLATLLWAPVILVVGAGPAAAHDSLLGSDPAAGSTVDAVPARITLRFAEPAQKLGTQIAVLGPDGDVAIGGPVLADATVSVAVGPGAPAGAYRVSWRVTSADGHPVEGSLRFTARSAGRSPTTSGAPSTAPATPFTAARSSTRPSGPPSAGPPAGRTAVATVDPARSRTVPVLVVLGVLTLGAVAAAITARRRAR